MEKAILLVGHGGVPTDAPPQLVSEFKRLEAQAKGRPDARLSELDARLRRWPRTAKTDPYKAGLEEIADALRRRCPDRLVLEAYNEFCAPTIEEACAEAVSRGATAVTVITTMYTRGGSHSECEIPAIVERLKARHPGVDIRNVWPFSLDAIADFLAAEIGRREGA